jgi:hypothetical protein
MNHEASKVKELDTILFYLKDNKDRDIANMLSDLNDRRVEKLTIEELQKALGKLEKDEYIDANTHKDIFRINWEGSFFIEFNGGYEFTVLKKQHELELIQNEKELLSADRKHNLAVAVNMEKNAKRLNSLTVWLAIGSGAIALIELGRILMPAYQYYCHCEFVWQK